MSKVTNMGYMFENAAAFNQDLTGWCVTNVNTINLYNFSFGATNFVSTNLPVGGTCPNTTPTDITLSASAIDENAATATTVGAFSTTMQTVQIHIPTA